MKTYHDWAVPHDPQRGARHLIPETLTMIYHVLPLSFDGGVLKIGVGPSGDNNAVRDIGALLGVIVKTVPMTTQEITDGLSKYYCGDERTMFDIADDLEKRDAKGHGAAS